jgi:hypothetical protein
VLGPLNAGGDREGCRIEDGQVRTPKGFKDAWKALYENGFKSLGVAADHGGQGAPHALVVLVEELLSGANPAFNMYPGLAFGAAETIIECGTPEQSKRYAEKMLDGTWGGTMCLTEPHAGSDVGSAKSWRGWRAGLRGRRGCRCSSFRRRGSPPTGRWAAATTSPLGPSSTRWASTARRRAS